MGPYCNFCDHRCFVSRVLRSTGRSLILATCPRGMAHDRKETGEDHTTAINPATAEGQAEMAELKPQWWAAAQASESGDAPAVAVRAWVHLAHAGQETAE